MLHKVHVDVEEHRPVVEGQAEHLAFLGDTVTGGNRKAIGRDALRGKNLIDRVDQTARLIIGDRGVMHGHDVWRSAR
ncbi:hypothetical protein D9M70_637210 [compost metagenome]